MQLKFVLVGLLMVTLFLTACQIELPQEALKQIKPDPDPELAAQYAADETLTEEQKRILSTLPNQGPAPELLNDTFLNSETLRLAELQGKVVIVDFWTYG